MFDTIGAVFRLTDSLVKLLRMLFLGLITLGSEIGLLVSSKAAVTCRDEQVCEDSEKLETDTRNDTQGSVESVSLEDVLCKSAWKGAYPVPSWDSVTKGGVLIERDKYMEIVEILRRRGLVYKRGKRYWFGAGITQEDVRDVLHEIVY